MRNLSLSCGPNDTWQILICQCDINLKWSLSSKITINRGHPFSFSTPSFQEAKALEKFCLKKLWRTWRTFEELEEHLKGLKNLKDNKSLISSKLEIYCEGRSIHLSIKVKKIFVWVKFNEDRIRGHSFVKESK